MKTAACAAIWVRVLGAAVFLLGLSSVSAAPARMPADYEVLIVAPFGQGLVGVDQFVQTTAERLRKAGLRSENIHIEYLDLYRHPTPAYRETLRRLIRLKHGGRKLDAVFTIAQPALDFMLEDVPEVAADAPLLAARAEAGDAGPKRTIFGLAQRIDYDTAFRQALALFPRTREVLIFIDDADENRRELDAMRSALLRLRPGLAVEDTSAMTLAQARDLASTLPRDAIVIDFGMQRDHSGRALAPFETRALIARAASVPAFLVYDIQLGQNGGIGGYVYSVQAEAVNTAEMALDIMGGRPEKARERRFNQISMYDWTQLRRWGADPDVLPASTVFVNRPATLWGQYRSIVIGAGAALAVLAGLATALAWQVRRKTRAERALQASEERYRNVVERAPEAIIVYDTESRRIIDHNSKAEQLFGRGREALHTSTMFELFAMPHEPVEVLAESIADNTRRALAGETVVIERSVYRPDGTSATCEIWVSRLSDNDSEASSTLLRASMVDISARRRAETALQEYRLDLERLVDERTSALSVALDQARAANRAKSVFLSKMSHEIRTPMNAILGYAQLLARRSDLDASARSHVQAVHQSGDLLLGLIDNVLDMSRVESGNVTLTLAGLDLHALLEELRGALAPKAAAKGLRLDIDAAPGVPRMIEGDEPKLRRVLVNLVGNGIKFTEHGQVRVYVDARPLPEERTQLIVDVADTGAGIGAAEQARIFDAFEQTQAGQAEGGAGLGMAISRQFARLMGGDVALRHTGPEGTVVCFTFTARVLHDGRAASVAPPRLAAGAAQPRILIVDDVAANREILKGMLGNAGFGTLRELERGSAVCDVAKDWRADLVLLDRRMPDMDGLDVVRALRAEAATRMLRVVIVSASVFEEDRRAAFAAGADGFISKPLREQQVLAEVARLCPGVRFDAAAMPQAPATLDSGADPAPSEPIDRALAVRLVELIEAGDALRFERCLAEELRDTHPAAYRQLLSLVQKFDYARILALLMPDPV